MFPKTSYKQTQQLQDFSKHCDVAPATDQKLVVAIVSAGIKHYTL